MLENKNNMPAKKAKKKTAAASSSPMNMPDITGIGTVAMVVGGGVVIYVTLEAFKVAQQKMADLAGFAGDKIFGTKEEQEFIVNLKNDLATPDTPSWVATLFHERLQFDPVASLTISYLWEKEGIDWQGIANDWERYMINDREFAKSVVLAYRYLYGGELIMMFNEKFQYSGKSFFRKDFPDAHTFSDLFYYPSSSSSSRSTPSSTDVVV
jgi:hypothetical protein